MLNKSDVSLKICIIMTHAHARTHTHCHQQCVGMFVIHHCNKKIQLSGSSSSTVSAANPEVTENLPTSPFIVLHCTENLTSTKFAKLKLTLVNVLVRA
jgi:hypothetical protein